eukprot:CAMPEP_0202768642 /NCGR_PEP_ID=MMETSP1388-20130828/35098_1 /ASSEMBLY_ACC=CAM_ASM_000864 /TAXON_ID=37098 /ORGANISM="Isochrysis sp, Strain CCMP1244" /LENGTH=193 /DNA_ID=CAMNT_0049437389 /DNA_START=96 /DNA_END=674 /DNA_ORIENTATION=-
MACRWRIAVRPIRSGFDGLDAPDGVDARDGAAAPIVGHPLQAHLKHVSGLDALWHRDLHKVPVWAGHVQRIPRPQVLRALELQRHHPSLLVGRHHLHRRRQLRVENGRPPALVSDKQIRCALRRAVLAQARFPPRRLASRVDVADRAARRTLQPFRNALFVEHMRAAQGPHIRPPEGVHADDARWRAAAAVVA